jgi:hypothetical protein
MDERTKRAGNGAPATQAPSSTEGASTMSNIAERGIQGSMYDERRVETAQELDELVRLRAELSYADWKAHPRFKKERVLREAQRKWGVPAVEALFWAGLLPANDVQPVDAALEASLASDMEFEAFCDERAEAFVAALGTMDEPIGDADGPSDADPAARLK